MAREALPRSSPTISPAFSSKNARKAPILPRSTVIPGRHGMTATLDQKALFDRISHQFSEVETIDRAARTAARAIGVEGDGESRTPRPLLQPRRDQPDDAGMPVVAGGDQHRRSGPGGKLDHRLGLRLFQHDGFHRLAFLVQPVEFLGNAHRFVRIVERQQPCAKPGIADPPARIDPRPD